MNLNRRFNSDPKSKYSSRPWHFRRGHSIMPKLILILIVTLVSINCVVGGFYRLFFSQHVHPTLQKNLGQYIYLLTQDLGNPPDTAKLQALAKQYSWRIIYSTPKEKWDSSPNNKLSGTEITNRGGSKSDVTLENRSQAKIHFVWKHGLTAIQYQNGDTLWIFSPNFQPIFENHLTYIAALLFILTCIFGCSFLILRKLLFPLKKLTAAVERLGQGELGHQIQICSHDEFGELAQSFNTMSTKLANLVQAREQLLLDVSHELRSPLTRIKLALELAPQGNQTENIREDIAEMENMVSEILEAARLDSVHGKLNLEEFDLFDLVCEIIKEKKITYPIGPDIIWISSKISFVKIKADRLRIKKVISNILDNALKFSRDQGYPIELNIEERSMEGMDTDNSSTEDLIHQKSSLLLTIRDHGPGIPSEEIPKLFEPFYRVDRSRSRESGGYGLGLSLCKRIMEAHGGNVEITSTFNPINTGHSGTTISLKFPQSAKIS